MKISGKIVCFVFLEETVCLSVLESEELSLSPGEKMILPMDKQLGPFGRSCFYLGKL